MAKRLQYLEADMLKAIVAARTGMMSIRKASVSFQVPRTTLIDKLKGRVPIERKIGASSILSSDEEQHLVTWILSSAKAGFPITKEQLTDSVQLLIKELKRENPFPDNRPQRHWHEGFLNRHPEIASIVSQNLSSQRANVTEEKIRHWFTEVYTYLKDNNFEYILDCPKRIFNCDETAMFLSPKAGKVLTHKGDRTVYTVINNDEKDCLTTLIVCNAAGTVAPPMIMYSYNRIPKHINDRVPKE
ncbi:hypothetical protein NQ315_014805 [Exocentrus adspersus]|uniref:HTH CENPB-type domain-containing protein n=1 Tax=Exocentrus adspersus TaxID=1586481 RepID=A0AAV8VM19_9CUCU|nr:hypothetical protein NQ315_014805 [Exocentrus adspersus]